MTHTIQPALADVHAYNIIHVYVSSMNTFCVVLCEEGNPTSLYILVIESLDNNNIV